MIRISQVNSKQSLTLNWKDAVKFLFVSNLKKLLAMENNHVPALLTENTFLPSWSTV